MSPPNLKARTPGRAGFTLIEILIAIAIISILVGLLFVGISSVSRSAKRAQTVTEINDLTTACTLFKKEFGIYPPTTFTIPNTTSDAGFVTFKRMFPRWIPADPANLGLPNAGAPLDCNQTLVYFLAGPDGNGWHPAQPTAPTGDTKKGPFFEFQRGRLVGSPPRYLDHFGTPYVYMAFPYQTPVPNPTYDSAVAYNTGPDYGPGSYPPNPAIKDPNFSNSPFIYPLRTLTGTTYKFMNPEGVQILSAGEDGTFGPGSPPRPDPYPNPPTIPQYFPWDPGTAPYVQGAAGDDDLANFNNGTQLGSNP